MPEKQWSLYRIMHFIIGDAPGMIFGNTGTGKSMLVRSVVQSAVRQKLKVAVCDTEVNYMETDLEWLQANASYSHAHSLEGVRDWVKKLTPGFRLVVLDSIGGPAYGQYVEADRKRAGDTFKMIAYISYLVQQYCQKNEAMAIVVNQPTSDFAGGSDADLGPFGGKAGFYTKELIRTVSRPSKDGWSISNLEVWKSRHTRDGMVLGSLGICDDNVTVKFVQYKGRRPDGYPKTDCVIPNPAMEPPEGKKEEEPEPEEEQNVGSPTTRTGDKTEEEENTQSPDESAEIPIEEETEEASLDGGDELEAVKKEIAEIRADKDIFDIQFNAIMKSKNVDVESSEKINDLGTAIAVKGVLEEFAKQRG